MQHPPGASAVFYQIDRVAATTQQKGSLKAGVANLRCNKPAGARLYFKFNGSWTLWTSPALALSFSTLAKFGS